MIDDLLTTFGSVLSHLWHFQPSIHSSVVVNSWPELLFLCLVVVCLQQDCHLLGLGYYLVGSLLGASLKLDLSSHFRLFFKMHPRISAIEWVFYRLHVCPSVSVYEDRS